MSYKKLYERYHGPIPKDKDGRNFDVHHKDGDRKNNSPENLEALSIEDHYNRHWEQGDYAACLYISARMSLTPQKISELASLSARRRIKDGTHHFLNSDLQRRTANARVADGTHPFLGGEMQKRTQLKIVESGKHHLQGGKIQRRSALKRLKDGTHNLIRIYVCPHCKTSGKGPVMFRHHFDNCRKTA